MLKRLLPFMGKYKSDALLSFLCSTLEAVAELTIPLIMAMILDTGISNGDIGFTLSRGAVMLLLAGLVLLFGVLSVRYSSRAGIGFGTQLRDAQFRSIQKFSFRNIEKFGAPSLITRLTGDVTAVQNGACQVVKTFCRAPMVCIVSFLFVFFINWKLSLIILVAVPIMGGGLLLILMFVRPLYRLLQTKIDNLNLVVQENLTAARVIKAFVRGKDENIKFEVRNADLYKISDRAFGFVVMNNPLHNLVLNLATVCLLFFGGRMVFAGELTIGQLTSFFAYLSTMLGQFMSISGVVMTLARSLVSVRRITEVLDEAPDIDDAAAVDSLKVEDGSVAFSGVSFKYNREGVAMVLTDVSLDIGSGATVGIIGGTGSAKSALVQLIPRLYDVDLGSVSVGGRDVRDYTMQELRDAVAMVLQSNTLFTGSIRDNLCWGKDDATDEELVAACRAACAMEFIEKLPDGFDTILGQGGVNVSGGQKQRLCIARALLKTPKILILDDSTSAVDTSTDAQIREALSIGYPGMTKIIIAQRVASVCDADMIVVLDEGQITDIGTHGELMKASAIYRDVYMSQLEGVASNV